MTATQDFEAADVLSEDIARRGGFYVAVEGIDGSGKSTLVDGLKTAFPDAAFTQEPKEELWTGQAVREALVSNTGPFTDALLFMADRAEHLHRFVKPALADGCMVISDRSGGSTYAYQAGRVDCVDPQLWFDECYAPWDVEPDVTLFIDVDPETAIERTDGDEKYEKVEFLREVRDRYDELEANNARWHRLDGDKSPEALIEEAVSVIQGEL